ncbi:hypothetical protein [Cupriavidus sp. PET2-C1]
MGTDAACSIASATSPRASGSSNPSVLHAAFHTGAGASRTPSMRIKRRQSA